MYENILGNDKNKFKTVVLSDEGGGSRKYWKVYTGLQLQL